MSTILSNCYKGIYPLWAHKKSLLKNETYVSRYSHGVSMKKSFWLTLKKIYMNSSFYPWIFYTFLQ